MCGKHAKMCRSFGKFENFESFGESFGNFNKHSKPVLTRVQAFIPVLQRGGRR